MRRRTRLRKHGLPPDPSPRPQPDPVQAYVQLSLDLSSALRNAFLPAELVSDLNVREDCRRYGVQQVVLSIRTLGDIPSNVLWRYGGHPLQRPAP